MDVSLTELALFNILCQLLMIDIAGLVGSINVSGSMRPDSAMSLFVRQRAPRHSQVILRRHVLPGLLKSQAAQSSSVTMAEG